LTLPWRSRERFAWLANGQGARGTRIKKNAPQITSEWNYRPRETIRRFAAVDSAEAESSEILGPERFAINNSVWLNDDSLESAAYTFMNLDPTEAPLWDHESAVSAYD